MTYYHIYVGPFDGAGEEVIWRLYTFIIVLPFPYAAIIESTLTLEAWEAVIVTDPSPWQSMLYVVEGARDAPLALLIVIESAKRPTTVATILPIVVQIFPPFTCTICMLLSVSLPNNSLASLKSISNLQHKFSFLFNTFDFEVKNSLFFFKRGIKKG